MHSSRTREVDPNSARASVVGIFTGYPEEVSEHVSLNWQARQRENRIGGAGRGHGILMSGLNNADYQ